MIEILWTATEREQADFFWKMSDAEADAFFDEYLLARDGRLKSLNRSFYEDGGGNENDLDFEPDSLPALWQWARRRIRAREHSAAEMEHILTLPDWFRRDQLNRKPLSDDSLVLINDIAYYFAEVLIRNLEGVEWHICKTSIKRYVDQNQPVLGGFSAPGFTLGVNPRDWIRGLALKEISCKGADQALVEAYEKCVDLRGGGQRQTR